MGDNRVKIFLIFGYVVGLLYVLCIALTSVRDIPNIIVLALWMLTHLSVVYYYFWNNNA